MSNVLAKPARYFDRDSKVGDGQLVDGGAVLLDRRHRRRFGGLSASMGLVGAQMLAGELAAPQAITHRGSRALVPGVAPTP